MPTCIVSTAYFPPISWMTAISRFDLVAIEISETYPKQTYRNRCNIATSSGVLRLSVPVIKVSGNHTLTREIKIDYSKPWQQIHWRSIVTAYSKTPYFIFYRDEIEKVLFEKYDLLIDLNTLIVNKLIRLLKISPPQFSQTSDYEKQPKDIDFRQIISPKNPQSANIFSFQRYIQAFEENTGFLQDLSILDLLFNLGPDAKDYLDKVKINLPGT